MLIMVRSQPDGSTLEIADQLKREMQTPSTMNFPPT